MRLAIIIPTVKGREESLARCLAAYKASVPRDQTVFEVIHDRPTCGEAWRVGFEVANATGWPTHVHFTADDLEPKQGWWQQALEATGAGFLPAAVVRQADGTLEAGGGDLNEPNNTIQDRLDPDWSLVDYSGIPFMSVKQFKEIGVPDIHYYSDVWISYAGLFHGYKTVLRHGYEFTHHWEQAGRGAGYTQGERNMLDGIHFRQAMIQRYGAMKP